MADYKEQNPQTSEGLRPQDKFVLKDNYTFQELKDLVAFLYSPEGCPWDRVQTHQSIKGSLVEEAWEAVDAIEADRPDLLADELGDVLLQVVFHAEMARVAGSFSMQDVLRHICHKLISRHSHIFAQDKASDPQSVLQLWNANKKREKGLKSETEVLEDVPKSLPALTRAYKIQKKAADCGFDWPEVKGARDKVQEELGELEEAGQAYFQAKSQDPDGPALQNLKSQLEEEAGDLLFAVVNTLRKLKVDPEIALNLANKKFIRRFGQMEALAKEQDKSLRDMDLEGMDQLWDAVKSQEKAKAEKE